MLLEIPGVKISRAGGGLLAAVLDIDREVLSTSVTNRSILPTDIQID
jgi:hypothetical protein